MTANAADTGASHSKSSLRKRLGKMRGGKLFFGSLPGASSIQRRLSDYSISQKLLSALLLINLLATSAFAAPQSGKVLAVSLNEFGQNIRFSYLTKSPAIISSAGSFFDGILDTASYFNPLLALATGKGLAKNKKKQNRFPKLKYHQRWH